MAIRVFLEHSINTVIEYKTEKRQSAHKMVGTLRQSSNLCSGVPFMYVSILLDIMRFM